VVHRSLKANGNQLNFEVRGPGNVKGITFIVVHPSADSVPKSVSPNSPGTPQPELRMIDDYRSAIIFKDILKIGNYAYNIEY
jgi:hypothetical protein